VTVSPETTTDHWWWRPGWRLGRSFYTWHITFADQPGVWKLLKECAAPISRFPTMDLVDRDGLHLTIQGIGFVDEIDESEVRDIVSATRVHCSQLEPIRLRIGPLRVDAETVQMPAQPPQSLIDLRLALRNGIADVWGESNVPETMEGFRPHVTFAYSNGEAPISEIESSLQATASLIGDARISTVSLIQLNRDRKRYEWNEFATVRLGK
jgi:2'-5' RNA ligase